MSSVKNEYLIEGYNVSFPYDAYECQINYMKKVLFSLKNKKHALLESPTGTGKTMCLLAATLAFQKHFLMNHGSIKKPLENSIYARTIKSEGGSIEIVGIPQNSHINNSKKEVRIEQLTPRIIYSSRTHTQLSQVMRELKSSGITDDFKIELFDSEIENKFKTEKSTTKKRSVIKGGKKLFKATILGSRDQLCVHPKISKFRGNALIKNCRKITKEGKCRYHNNLKQANITGVAADIQDIEDLRKIASSSESGYFCPFYATREIESVCNVVLLPYNYLLDSITRQNLKIDLTNTILILDEAHNVESVAEEAYSFDLRDIDLALSQKAIQNILEATKLDIIQEKESEKDLDLDISFDIEVAVALVTGIHLLSKNLKQIPCPINRNNANKSSNYAKIDEVKGLTYPGSHIYTLFASSGFGRDNFQAMDECLTNMINFGQNIIVPGSNVSNQLELTSTHISVRIGALERFQRCLRLTFNETVMKNPQWFKLYIHYESDQFKEIENLENNENYKNDYSENSDDHLRLYLSFWCFSPAAALSSLVSAGVRSMIITSGTLSPLDSLAQQFSCSNVTFDVFLENEHVINNDSQLWAGAVERGNQDNDTQLIGSYGSRSNPSYFSALGSVVLDCVKRIPDGMLLFFASYTLMDQAIKYWTDQGFLDRIKAFKSVFIEPRNSFELGSVLEAYMDSINKRHSLIKQYEVNLNRKNSGNLTNFISKTNKISYSGSILVAVCRGKISEGINFSDHACRGVIIAGLPFPSIADPKISLKKQYMDESNMDGRQWYNQQAIRAVNQAIGRVVRHKNDYGTIILADKRFNQRNIYSNLSKWIRTKIRHLPQLDHNQLNSISSFFEKKLDLGDQNFYLDKQFDKEVHIKTSNIFNKNPSTVSFPNLSNEINTLLNQISNKNFKHEDSKNEDSNIGDAEVTREYIKSKDISSTITKISAPWKKIKTSPNVSKNIWKFSTQSSQNTKENQKNKNFSIIPIETDKNQYLINRTKNLIGVEEFNRLKPYMQNINSINSTSLNKIVDCLLPSYLIEEKEINERKSLAFEYSKLMPFKYRDEFIILIENIVSNIDMMKDKALVDALENDL